MGELRHGFGGALHIADVRLLVLVERRGHADGDRVHLFDEREIRSGGKPAGLHHVFEGVAHDVADIIVPGVDGLHLFGLHVEADGAVAGLCELHGQRQADVAEAHDADDGGPVFDFAEKLRFDS